MHCDYKITYVDSNKDNEKEWILFLHGIGGNHIMWRRQIDFLSDKFNTCAVTLPSHGDNSSGIDEKDDNIYDHLADIILSDLKAMGVQRIYIISVSMGTIIANKILEKDNSFVKKSLLVGAVCGANKLVSAQAQMLTKCARFLPYKFIVNSCARLLMPKLSHKKSREFLVAECLKLKEGEFIKWIKALFANLNYIKKSKLDESKCVLVVGDEDFVFKKGIKATALRDHLKLHTIKNCGHVCNLQKRKDFNAIMCSFLAIVNYSAIE